MLPSRYFSWERGGMNEKPPIRIVVFYGVERITFFIESAEGDDFVFRRPLFFILKTGWLL